MMLVQTRWNAYALEARRVEIPVTSTLTSAQIASAVLNITGMADTAMTVSADAEGYKLIADPVVMPVAGVYQWSASVVEVGGLPVIVAAGDLHVAESV